MPSHEASAPGLSPSPRASVVIPAYNYASYLKGAIDSVLSQTFTELEVIVVDDGSTDNTREIVAEYTDRRVRYVHQTNAGLSAARNTGIRNARAPYVGFLDADDQWLPELLQRCLEKFSLLPPEFAWIATGVRRVDHEGNPIPSRPGSLSGEGELTCRDFILKNRPLSSSVVIKREVFDRCGFFDTQLRSSEDRDMWIRIGAHYRLYFLASPLALLRRHPANMSKHALRMKENTGRVLRKAYNSGAVPKWDLPFWLRVWAIYFFQIGWTHFDEGRKSEALRYMIFSLCLWPWFPSAQFLNEPPLFRVRALARFLISFLRPTPHAR